MGAVVKREALASMGPLERKALLEDVARLVHTGEWRFGEAVRFLRAVVLRKNRETFARLVGLSTAALQKLEERPDANPTLDTLNRVLRPFGGAVGVVFPRMHPPPPPTVDDEQRLATLEAALAGTRRKKPAPAAARADPQDA
jgi:DNA-binding phage protein